MRFLLIIFLLCIPICLLIAQNAKSYKLQGVVIEASGNKPVPYSSVYVKNYDHIGTATGADGSFELTIPAYAQNDVLVFSSLGYSSQEISLATLQHKDRIRVLLKPMVIMLSEVTISAAKYDLEKICLTAVKQLPNNYPTKRHYLKGFYRKVSTDSTKFTGLIEAQLGIIDESYKSDENKIQVQVLNARYGDNSIVWDSMLIKMGAKMKAGFDDLGFHVSSAQSLHRLYESNLIRLYNKPSTFFNVKDNVFDSRTTNNNIKRKIDLDDVSILNGDTILTINYQWYTPSGQRLDAVKIAVNLSDYGILEFERGFFREHIHIKFKKQSDGNYYPIYIKRVTPVIFDKAKQKRYYNIELLEVDQIEIDSKRKLKQGMLEDRDVDFDIKRFKYDSSFWENYMKTNQHPLNSDVQKSLEQKMPLKKQFTHQKN